MVHSGGLVGPQPDSQDPAMLDGAVGLAQAQIAPAETTRLRNARLDHPNVDMRPPDCGIVGVGSARGQGPPAMKEGLPTDVGSMLEREPPRERASERETLRVTSVVTMDWRRRTPFV